jgi:hypothetical protein
MGEIWDDSLRAGYAAAGVRESTGIVAMDARAASL